mgnify:CR=1 FL=1
MVMSLLAGISFISCGNSSRAKVESEAAQTREDFKSFLDKFTSSAAVSVYSCQVSVENAGYFIGGMTGKLRKRSLLRRKSGRCLDSETLKEERITQEEGGIYVSKFTLNEPAHKVFEAGYEESEIDLRVEFELLPDGKWYVVDCYTGWYGYDLPIAELKQTIQHVQEENAAFKELHPLRAGPAESISVIIYKR